MQFMCLRPNINTSIGIILGRVFVFILIAQVTGDDPFQQHYYKGSGIDLRGHIKGKEWVPKEIKYHALEDNDDHPVEPPQIDLDEQLQQPENEQTDEYESEWQDQFPDDQSPDGQPIQPPNDQLGPPPWDGKDTVPLQPGSQRWPYECIKGHPEPHFLSETCSSNNSGLCNLCADDTVLLCCGNITPRDVVRNGSLETIYLQYYNEAADNIFQNITASRVYIRSMHAAIEEGAFRGSDNIEILHIQDSHFGHTKRMDLIFEGLYKMKVLNLDDNGITMWETTDTDVTNSDKSLRKLPSLEILSLKRNLFETLGSNFFEWLEGSPLRYLNLEGCNQIVKIDPGVLLPVRGTLWFLELAYTNIEEDNLTNLLSSNLTELKSLGLKSTGLQNIPRSSLEMVNSSLEVLSLQDNNLNCISGNCDRPTDVPPGWQNGRMVQDIFPYMPKLRELSLANCGINEFPENTFNNLENLRKLYIHKNSYSMFKHGIFCNLKKLKYLNMQHISSEKELEIDFSGLNSLESLDASNTKIPMSELVFCNLPNLKELVLKDSEVLGYEPTVSKCFTNLEVLHLSRNQVLCDNFYEIFMESLKLTELILSDCAYHDLNEESNAGLIRNLKQLKVLSLERNNFASIDALEFIESLHNLETLNLNQNKLVSWDYDFLSNNINLKNIFISSNQITSISKGMMMTFLTLDTLDASNNPYLCFCSLTHFNEFAETLSMRKKNCDKFCTVDDGMLYQETVLCLEKCRKESKYNEDLQEMIDYVNNSIKAEDINLDIIGWNEGAYQCLDNSGRRNIEKFKFHDWQCFPNDKMGYTTPEGQIMATWKIVVIAVSCVMVLMLGICYWKWRYIYQFGRAVRSVTMLRLLDDENDKPNKAESNARSNFSYDVFISYSDPNRQWVLEELVPNFENGSDLKVCLHERDFQVGLSILENIISCMDQSRSLLLVISQAFLRSQWCQFELHMAQHRLLETRREDLILVLLEEIPTSRRPKMLRYLMLTKTYIQWPGYDAGAEERKMFWKRLRRAVLLPRMMQNQDAFA